MQTLTAVVKLFLIKPDSSQAIVQKILNTATRDCDSPDVRDRAYIYWRLLSMDPAAAKVRMIAYLPCDPLHGLMSGCRIGSPTAYFYPSDYGGAGFARGASR